MKNYGREPQAKVGIPHDTADRCHRKKKDIKKSIADRKDDIALMREVMTRDLSDYAKVNETIGRLYMNLVYLKEELKAYKKQGKK